MIFGKTLLQESLAGAFVAIEPSRCGAAEVPHRMERASWNEHFFTWFRSCGCSRNLELDVSLQDHHEFIDRVSIVLQTWPGGSVHRSQLNPLSCHFDRTALMLAVCAI